MAHLTNTNSNTACYRELQDADGAAATTKRRCTEYIYIYIYIYIDIYIYIYIYMGLRDRKNEKKRK
jgi:hypothetical protein